MAELEVRPILEVDDLVKHFPITRGILFKTTDRRGARRSTGSASSCAGARRSAWSASPAAASRPWPSC